MGKNNKTKSILMAGTILAGGMLSASEAPQQDNRNFVENAVHMTTSAIDTAVHATTETLLYPVRGTAWLLSETGRQTYNGLNYIGNNTGVVGKMITKPLAKTVNFALNSTGNVLNSAADIAQTAVEYPVAMAGATLDATATATRDTDEAARKFEKESLILTSETVATVTREPNGLINGAIFNAQDIARTTVKGVADATASGVGLIDKEAGETLQGNIDMVDGAVIATQTIDTMGRTLLMATPTIIASTSPLLNEDIRGLATQEIKDQMENADGKTTELEIPENMKQLTNEAVETIQKPTASKLKSLLRTFSRTMDKEEEKISTPTPAPRYNPETGTRDGAKEIIQASEIYRMSKNNGR